MGVQCHIEGFEKRVAILNKRGVQLFLAPVRKKRQAWGKKLIFEFFIFDLLMQQSIRTQLKY